jgi:hypothetical protein
LLPEADASALLGVEVEYIDFVDLDEEENGSTPQDEPLSPDELRAVEAAGEQACTYREVDGEAFVLVQLSRGVFHSVDEFRGAWDDDVEILTTPGLAATFTPGDGESSGTVVVLLNDRGDGFGLSTHQADVGRDELLEAASEATKRYSS